jgi:hypothetical protein
MKPKLFIGSSVEGLIIAENIKVKLDYNFDIDVWNEGVFGIGNTTIDDLLKKLEESDFGIFVFTPDDKAVIRNLSLDVVRDNVLYELGLYTGKLGRKNSFIITSDNLPKNFHLPSDLIGINLGTYKATLASSNPESAVSTFCTKLKSQIFNPSKYPLGGKWLFTWEIQKSANYSGPITELVDVFHYENVLKFIHSVKTTEKYMVNGELSNRYLTGSFRDLNNVGYDGAFQMTLNGQADSFEGLFIGWQNSGTIGSGPCSLKRQ